MTVVFQARDALTPHFAAKLSQEASRYRSNLVMEYGQRRLRLDSLINILSVDLRRGGEVTVVAEGEDERQAAEGIRDILTRADT